MKGFIVGLIILGGLALVGGAVCVGYAAAHDKISDDFVTNEYTFDDDVDNIKIDLATADLEFRKATDEKTKVVCVEKEKVYHAVDVKDGTLEIEQVDERRWYQKYIFNINFKSMKVTVYLPEDTYNNLKVETDTGSINLAKGFTFADMDLKSDTGGMSISSSATGKITLSEHTGDILLDNINADSIKSNSSTGRFTYKGGKVNDSIEVKSSTGDIILENVEAKTYTSNCSTGDVKLTNVVIENELKIKTSTGGVRFDKSDAGSLKVETSTGSVKGTLLTPKIFDCKSDTGSIHIPSAQEWSGGICEVKTDTGSITLSIQA